MSPQNGQLLDYLKRHPEGITALGSLRHLGIMRLAARVWELRQSGVPIEAAEDILPTGARIARYRLVRQDLGL